MNHSFDIDNAKSYGIIEAVLIDNLSFWIEKNKANGRHFYEGRYWTYNSAKAFADLFPYLSVNQVRRALDSLERHEIIVRGNFNQSAYDRTAWYAFSDKWISQKGNIHLAKTPNGFDQNNEPIPDTKPAGKQVDKQDKAARRANVLEKPDSVSEQTWEDFKKIRAAKRSPLTETGLSKISKQAQLAGFTLEQALQTCCERGWQGFSADWVLGNARASGFKKVAKTENFDTKDYGQGIQLI